MSNTFSATTTDGREVVLHEDGGWSFRRDQAEGDAAYDFRKTRWGMSPDLVRAAETAELLKASDNGLIFKDRIVRFPCLVAYIFALGQLVRAKYNLLAEHAVPSEYLSDFEYLQGVLQNKYGDPAESQQHWLDDRYKDDQELWGRALTLGHLVLYEAWSTDSTEISLMLRGEEGRVLLEIEYSSLALQNLEDEQEEKPNLDLF